MIIVVDCEENANLLNEKINENSECIVLIYMDGCYYCKLMESEWNKLETNNRTSNDIVVAKVEQQHLGLLTMKPEIKGYPTIFKNKNNNLEEYQGERNCEGFQHFIKPKSSKKEKSSKKGSSKGKKGSGKGKKGSSKGKAGKKGSGKGKAGKSGSGKGKASKSGSGKGKAGKAGKAGKSGKADKSGKSSKAGKVSFVNGDNNNLEFSI